MTDAPSNKTMAPDPQQAPQQSAPFGTALRMPWLGSVQSSRGPQISPAPMRPLNAKQLALVQSRLLSLAVALDIAAAGLQHVRASPTILVAFAQALLVVRQAGGDKAEAEAQARVALNHLANGPDAATRPQLADTLVTAARGRAAFVPQDVEAAAVRLTALSALLARRAELSLAAKLHTVRHQA